jgi:hypothetical protein
MLPVMAQQKEQSTTMRPEGFVRNWMAPVGDTAGTRFKVSARGLSPAVEGHSAHGHEVAE